MGPWLLLLVYDFVFYLWRTATYAIPVVGGRARGRQPPKAPTLTERPSGRPRGFSFKAPDEPVSDESTPSHESFDGEIKRRNFSQDTFEKE